MFDNSGNPEIYWLFLLSLPIETGGKISSYKNNICRLLFKKNYRDYEKTAIAVFVLKRRFQVNPGGVLLIRV
jgi:hypothetical protein